MHDRLAIKQLLRHSYYSTPDHWDSPWVLGSWIRIWPVIITLCQSQIPTKSQSDGQCQNGISVLKLEEVVGL